MGLIGEASLTVHENSFLKSGACEGYQRLVHLWEWLVLGVREGSMNVSHNRQWVLGVLVALILSGIGAMDPSNLQASVKWRKESKQPAAPPTAATGSPRAPKASRTQSGIQPQGRIGKSLAVEPAKKPADQAVGQAHRRLKGSKKQRPQATVQAKPDLSYHGILERPQRYDPRRDHRKGASPNPQIGDVLHDHFQELDKNHDGAIDPIERVTGRTNLDRDL
jgi:hypothetical protein